MLQKFIDKTFGIAIIVIIAAFIGLVLHLFNKVASGHGLDYYFSRFGYKLNYPGALILLAIIPLFGVLA
jgi:hypothetical protein